MMEEWSLIPEFPGYSVSNLGYVQNNHTGRTMARSLVQYGMPTVAMMYEGKQYRRSIATLVARAFLDPPPRSDFNTPIHLDGDRKNCQADNLMWRPRWFAICFHMEHANPPFPDWRADIRLVETGEPFEHISEPAHKYGLLQRDIHQSIVNGVAVFPYGFNFTLIEN